MYTIPTPYEDLLRTVLEDGENRTDRTGTGTRAVFGAQLRYNLAKGFPLLTTKKVPLRLVAEELFWFLRGETNISSLLDKDVHIWDEWADANGNLGRVYGSQWRNYTGTYYDALEGPNGETLYHRLGSRSVDQIAQLQHDLKHNPDSRRHLVSAWNPVELDSMALPPCHYSFQLDVSQPADGGRRRLSILVNQRSADLFLGVPFNLASYALLCHLLAAMLDYRVGDLIWNGGNCHIYNNHLEQVREQLSRDARPYPMLMVNTKRENAWDYQWEDISLLGYNPHPTIKAPVSV